MGGSLHGCPQGLRNRERGDRCGRWYYRRSKPCQRALGTSVIAFPRGSVLEGIPIRTGHAERAACSDTRHYNHPLPFRTVNGIVLKMHAFAPEFGFASVSRDGPTKSLSDHELKIVVIRIRVCYSLRV